MPRQVHHLECSITEIDHVAVDEEAGRRGRDDCIVFGLPPRGRQRIDEQVAEVGAARREVAAKPCWKITHAEGMKLPIRIHPRRFDTMHQAEVEFMQSTDVVVVDMRRARDYGTLNKGDDWSAHR